MLTNSSTVTDSDILAEVIVPARGDLPPEVARSMLQWKFTDRAVARMNSLANRNNKGTITEVEAEELQSYLRVGSLVNLVQAKAQLSLKPPAASGP